MGVYTISDIFTRDNRVDFSHSDVFVVAEIGKNFIQTEDDRPFSEYMKNAKELIDVAVESGADAVKFQVHAHDEQDKGTIISPHFKEKGRYQWIERNISVTTPFFWKEIKQYADQKNILFFVTPMSKGAAQRVSDIDLPFWKVGSGDLNDYVLLDYLISTKKPIIISTGMSSLQEVDTAVSILRTGKAPFGVLYCVSKYPAPAEYFNLGTIDLLKEKYTDAVIGFSDHSIGSEIALAAIHTGATILEKHLSMSRSLWGPDHKASLNPEEFKMLVSAIRSKDYEKVDPSIYYGEKEKELEGATNEFRKYFYKKLVASKDIQKGDVITKDAISARRPSAKDSELPSTRFYDIIGKRANIDIKQGAPISKDQIT